MIEQFEELKTNGKGLPMARTISKEDGKTVVRHLAVMRSGDVILETIVDPILDMRKYHSYNPEVSRETLDFAELPELLQEYIVEFLKGNKKYFKQTVELEGGVAINI